MPGPNTPEVPNGGEQRPNTDPPQPGYPDSGKNVSPHGAGAERAPTESEVRNAELAARRAEFMRLAHDRGMAERVEEAEDMGRSPGQYSQEERDAHLAALEADITPDPELSLAFQSYQELIMDEIARQTEAARGAEIIEGQQVVADEGHQANQDGAQESSQQSAESETQDAAARRDEQMLNQTQEAMRAYENDPLDVDKRRAAMDAIREAQEHHDKEGKHGADGLGKGDPFWAKLLKGLGIAFYIYVGLQYAAAAAAEQYGKSGSKGGH